MYGPQAYENLFQTKHEPMKKYEVQHEGKTYVYSYDWEIIEMHESMTTFKEWCIEDAVERHGEYADEVKHGIADLTNPPSEGINS